MHYRFLCFIFLFLFAATCAGQADSARQGTVKIARLKQGPVYIKANADFGIKGPDSFQPFPVVEGYSFPFNYTRFFKENFKSIKMDLQGKDADTVYMEVKVSKKGKIMIKDVSPFMTNGKRAFIDGARNEKMKPLAAHCFNFLMNIKEWFPAYDIDPQTGKYKGETVIKPVKIKKDATGIIRIIFSYDPPE